MINKLNEINKKIKESLSFENVRKTFVVSTLVDSNNKTENPSGKEEEIFISDNDVHKKIDFYQINPPYQYGAFGGPKGINIFVNTKWQKQPETISNNPSAIAIDSNGNPVIDDYIVHKYDVLAKDIMGIERNDENAKSYKKIYLQEIEGEFIDLFNRELVRQEKFVSRAQEIWEDVVTGEFRDIFGVIDEQQKEIIFKHKDSSENLVINGFAGSGKTVVGHELIQASASNENKALVIYANDPVRKKAIDLFGNVSYITFDTYDGLNKKLLNKREKFVEEFSKITEQLSYLPKAIWKNVAFEKSGLKFKVQAIDQKAIFGADLEVYGEISPLELKVALKRLKIEMPDSKIIDAARIIEVNNLTNPKYNEVFQGEVMNVPLIMLDEAPIVQKYKDLYRYLVSNKSRKIFTYDKFQHDEFDESVFDAKVESLSVVYRTTKQIFSFATKGLSGVTADVPVSVENSITFTNKPKFETQIKLSDFSKHPDKYIGNEFKYLSIEIDKKIKSIEAKNIYILFTRAIRELNLFGKYAKELEVWNV